MAASYEEVAGFFGDFVSFHNSMALEKIEPRKSTEDNEIILQPISQKLRNIKNSKAESARKKEKTDRLLNLMRFYQNMHMDSKF